MSGRGKTIRRSAQFAQVGYGTRSRQTLMGHIMAALMRPALPSRARGPRLSKNSRPKYRKPNKAGSTEDVAGSRRVYAKLMERLRANG